MSELPASALVEVTTVPQNQPPATTPSSARKTPPAPSGVPGVPLAVAVANALGVVGAGALSLGGPVSLAVAGTAAGAAAIGGLARRARNRRTDPHAALRRAAAQRTTAAASPMPGLGPTPSRRQATRPGVPNFPLPQAGYRPTAPRPGASSGGARTTGPSTSRPAGSTGTAAHRHAPAGTRTGGAAGGLFRSDGRPSRPGAAGSHRPSNAAHTLAKAAAPRLAKAVGTHAVSGGGVPGPGEVKAARRAARKETRLAKIAERSAKRVAKGQAAAERAAGIDPATGAGTQAKSLGVGRKGLTPVQSKALRRSAMRHGVRMAGAAAATGLVVLGSVAVGNWRHPGRVAGHLRRTWARLAGRAREVRAARDAGILGVADAAGHLPGVPVPAEFVNIPGRPPRTADADTVARIFARPERHQPGQATETSPIALGKPTTEPKKETRVSTPLDGTNGTFSITSATDVILQAATTFEPEKMADFQTLIEELPDAYITLQDVLRVLAESAAEKLPVSPTVVEEIGTAYRAMNGVVAALQEVAPVYRKAHAEDLERHENPRNGLDAERKWNV
ncbi:hypothetical protein ACFYS8_13150 [Kitasatospora sp. NPDC004615]|uniref:hypothetical protein n=1 Tax=Kitasatospora sp. NPDC004615 TaxID=3364017 RepID=UPI00369AB0DF